MKTAPENMSTWRQREQARDTSCFVSFTYHAPGEINIVYYLIVVLTFVAPESRAERYGEKSDPFFFILTDIDYYHD